MHLSDDHQRVLKDLYGVLPNGKPRLRIVTPTEAVHPHGSLAGTPKYFDPESKAQMPFLVLEQWYPPEMCGSRDNWQYELKGTYPADCHKDCCNGGFWGFRLALTNQWGEYIPFSEQMVEAIRQRQLIDEQWAMLDEQQQLDHLNESLSLEEKQKDDDASRILDADRDHYLTHKEQMDNADNRVTIGLGKNTLPAVKGGKMPIGSPLEKL